MKPLYFLIIMLVGIGIVILDATLISNTSDDSTKGFEKYSPRASEKEESARPLRVIGVIIAAAGGIPFAIWKTIYFFEATGRHGY